MRRNMYILILCFGQYISFAQNKIYDSLDAYTAYKNKDYANAVLIFT